MPAAALQLAPPQFIKFPPALCRPPHEDITSKVAAPAPERVWHSACFY